MTRVWQARWDGVWAVDAGGWAPTRRTEVEAPKRWSGHLAGGQTWGEVHLVVKSLGRLGWLGWAGWARRLKGPRSGSKRDEICNGEGADDARSAKSGI